MDRLRAYDVRKILRFAQNDTWAAYHPEPFVCQ